MTQKPDEEPSHHLKLCEHYFQEYCRFHVKIAKYVWVDQDDIFLPILSYLSTLVERFVIAVKMLFSDLPQPKNHIHSCQEDVNDLEDSDILLHSSPGISGNPNDDPTSMPIPPMKY